MNTTPDNPWNPGEPYFPCEPVDMAFFDEGPVRYRNVVTLPVSAEALFDVFEDPKSWPRWATGIGRVIWTSDEPYGPGTTRTVVFWGGMEVYETFIDWERGHSMAFTFTGITQEIWSRFGERYLVEDHGDGTCTLDWTVAYDPTGGFRRWHRYIQPILGFAFRTYMRNLVGYCRKLPKAPAQIEG